MIGGGYTGLSAAYHLAREHGIRAVVLEAGPIGWGASGRNGGFCGLGGTKLGYGVMAQRFGVPAAVRFFRAQKAGVALVRSPPRRRIDLSLPARASTTSLTAPPAGWRTSPPCSGVRRALAALAQGGGGGAPAALARGARLPRRAALFRAQPLRYVRGSPRPQSAAAPPSTPGRRSPRGSGPATATASPPGGTVTAERVLVATNGYTPEGLDPALLRGRVLPALSSIVVTR